MLAYAVPPVVAVFLLGMFWRGANADGAAAAMRWGSVLGFALFLVNVVFQWTHFHFLYAAPILTLLDSAILAAVSLQRPERVSVVSEATMWTLGFSRSERVRLRNTPFWQDYRIHAAVLLVLTAAIVIIFR